MLIGFPRQWWNRVVAELLQGPDAPGASSFAEAAFELASDLFESAPEIVVRWVDRPRAFAWLHAHGELARTRLADVVQRSEVDWRWRAAAFLLLLDFERATMVARTIESLDQQRQKTAAWVLSAEGWEYHEGTLRPLWPAHAFHLAFDAGYILAATDHPTWNPTAFEPGDHAFGGRVHDLHHVLTLDPVPADVGVTIPRLVLGIDLDFAYEDGSEQYFHHRADGTLVNELDRAPDHPAFAPTRVRLAAVRPEYLVQDWGTSNGQENLFRLGGPPVFVQSLVHPTCVECRRTMVHLLSLDSQIKLTNVGPNGVSTWDWGSGGVANAFWCDACRVSAWTHTCT